MVTHLTTSPPIHGLKMAERTGCLVFHDLWSYALLTMILQPIFTHKFTHKIFLLLQSRLFSEHAYRCCCKELLSITESMKLTDADRKTYCKETTSAECQSPSFSSGRMPPKFPALNMLIFISKQREKVLLANSSILIVNLLLAPRLLLLDIPPNHHINNLLPQF